MLFTSLKDAIQERLIMIRDIPERIDSAVFVINSVAASLEEAADTLGKTYQRATGAIEQAFDQKPPSQKPGSSTTSSTDVIIEAEYEYTETSTPQISHQPLCERKRGINYFVKGITLMSALVVSLSLASCKKVSTLDTAGTAALTEKTISDNKPPSQESNVSFTSYSSQATHPLPQPVGAAQHPANLRAIKTIISDAQSSAQKFDREILKLKKKLSSKKLSARACRAIRQDIQKKATFISTVNKMSQDVDSCHNVIDESFMRKVEGDINQLNSYLKTANQGQNQAHARLN